MTQRKLSLAAARVNAGISQKQAAERLGVKPLTVTRWEQGKAYPRIDHVLKMSEMYDIPIDDIFFTKQYELKS